MKSSRLIFAGVFVEKIKLYLKPIARDSNLASLPY